MAPSKLASRCLVSLTTKALLVALPLTLAASSHASTKRGLGLSVANDTSLNSARLSNINAAWYYTWGYTGDSSLNYSFVPMVWTGSDLDNDPVPSTKYAYILGFNEPDKSSQANMSVSTALSDWPDVVDRGTFVVSPATAQDPVTGTYGGESTSWLEQFMASSPHVDAIAVHHYGCDASSFESELKSIHSKWNLPIWVTEFACETISEASSSSSSHPSQSDVDSFISTMKSFLDNTSWIQRYAWHDAKQGTSALFTSTTSSTLTQTGKDIAGDN